MVAAVAPHRGQGSLVGVQSSARTTSPNSSRWGKASCVIESLLSAQTTVPCPRLARGFLFLFMAAPHAAGTTGCTTRRGRPRSNRSTDGSPGVAVAISASMSARYQTVVLGPSLTGLGYLPLLTPAHHDEVPTGTNSRTCLMRRKPRCARGSAGADGKRVLATAGVLQRQKVQLPKTNPPTKRGDDPEDV